MTRETRPQAEVKEEEHDKGRIITTTRNKWFSTGVTTIENFTFFCEKRNPQDFPSDTTAKLAKPDFVHTINLRRF